MERLTMLGTGCAMVTKCYNTCFTLSDGTDYFLIDTGGGNTILVNLEKAGIEINRIHNVFISHSHNDHILGIVWIVRAVAEGILKGKYEGNLTIYCHKSIIDIIRALCIPTLQKKHTDFLDSRILFQEVNDGYSADIMGCSIKFFDIKSTKDLQFGFTTHIKKGRKLTFLGDEPYRESLYEYAVDSDYLLHEAFCLYSQKDAFKPYEKSHATVKDACKNASLLGVKNIILYHTEDKNIKDRKALYTREGSEYFKGSIFVPEDLEIIELI